VEPSRPLDLYAASLRAKGGDVVGAIAFLEEMLEESPEDAEVLYNIGVIHGEAKNVEEAIRYMRIVLGLNPDHASALNYVGYTFAERGENLDEAEAMIARALELRPEDGYITDSLGWVYYMRAQPLLAEGNVVEARPWLDRAIDELERAAELTGGDPVISEHLGDVYLALGDKERALDYYEEAVGLDPRPDEQPDLHQKLRRLRGELGQR
jgi:tetratricopeptide (TPR) repeat protein